MCPEHRKEHIPADRIKLVKFYETNGKSIYSLRSKSTNALTEHINSLLMIDPLAVRGYDKTCASVLLSVLLYQIVLYYNYKNKKNKKDNPRATKHMLWT